MTCLPTLPARRFSFNPTLRAAGAAGLAAALVLSLAACKGGDDGPLTPAAAALAASAPAVAAAHVPAPPVIQQASTAASAPSAPTDDLAAANARLEATLNNASACTADTECHSVAVGAKACGGPTGYRAYSSKTVSTASVEAQAQHQRDLAAEAARASHQVSPCFMLADPGAHCEQHKCVTGPA
jgi:hypothetical protein